MPNHYAEYTIPAPCVTEILYIKHHHNVWKDSQDACTHAQTHTETKNRQTNCKGESEKMQAQTVL
jgi:hypothetical protein